MQSVKHRVEQRALGRKEAAAILELVSESVGRLSPEAMETFREELVRFVRPFLDTPETAPMTDVEVRRFEQTMMPFGKYANHYIEVVPLGYLDWLVGQQEEFYRNVSRYLKNETIAARLKDELDATTH